MTSQESYIQKHKKFEDVFMVSFRRGDLKAFIILDYPKTSEKPVITLIHRMRMGPDILIIPAWVNQEKADKSMQDAAEGIFTNSRVVEISHVELQTMIDNHQIAPGYPKFSTYHLDFQVDQEEVDKFLKMFDDE